jgi:hypothetical protein
MRTNSTIIFLAAMPLLIGASPQPVRLQPSAAWVLDYAEDSCKLSRPFGKDDDQTLLQFESTAPGELSMIAIGRPLQTGAQEIPAKFVPVQDKAFKGEPELTTSKKPAVLWAHISLLPAAMVARDKAKAEEKRAHPDVRPPPLDFRERDETRAARQAFASAATALEIDARRNRPVILETGSLGEAIKMFDQCSHDSLRDWGVDPDVEDKIARPAWARDAMRWFSANDYPRAMWVQGKESEVRVRLLVDATGKASKCTSLSHFNEPDFNRTVCAIFMKRARIEPAELADGTKVPSYYINRVVFKMER